MTTARPKPGEPAEFDALVDLAQREHRAGRLAEAAEAYGKILALRPDIAVAYNNLGNVLSSQGKLDEAVARYQEALALKPDYAEAHSNLANALKQQGKFDQALARYERALALKPDFADAHFNLGNLLKQQGKLDQAAARFAQAVALRPNYVEAHSNLGILLAQQGKLDQAVAHFEQAAALRPDYAQVHSNLGNVLWEQGKLDQAVARLEQALALRPDFADAHYNLGNVLKDQNKLDEAAAHFEQALALRPDYADAQFGAALCYLVAGDYERGWPAYEGRLRRPGSEPQPNLPRWSGEPLAGRSLLLLSEQGIGDTLQLIRYARLLKDRGARVVLAGQPALGRLLESHPDFELFILGSTEELPRSDYYLPLHSVPGALHTTASTIPCEVPYLWADPALTDQWRAELAGTGGFKIGIVWQGSRDFVSDRWRSMSLAHFAPLARIPGVRLISLQKGFGSEQVATVDFSVLDLSDRLDEVAGPFMDTAAVLRNLDLVVTADTAIGHLAGAMGVPVYLALQLSANWRWLRDRDDTPWYPTMRLFRQTRFGEWPDVFERMAQAVQARRSETK